MNPKYRFPKLLSILLVLSLLLINASFNTGGVARASQSDISVLEAPQQSQSITGWFNIIWADSINASNSAPAYTLAETNGQTSLLLMDDALAEPFGGVLALNRTRVSVTGVWAPALDSQGAPTSFRVSALTPAPSASRSFSALPVVSGSKPWISLMCKFNNLSVEPRNLTFFQGMYANSSPGLDHYWREQSYGTVNITGSNAAGWFTLPHPESYYNPTDTRGGTDLSLLASECAAAADSSVDFSRYIGINMMFNSDFDNGYATGGGEYLSLDGVSKIWSVTWEPPWAYADVSVIQHEMGHGFGLPHSSGTYGLTYDNVWDVMSDDRDNCAASTSVTYGCIGQGTISFHKDRLGWIPAARKYTAGLGSSNTISLEQLTLPQTSNYLMAQIPMGGSLTHFYTVEARRPVGYDIKLPGPAVIIHEVDTTRKIPAHVLDGDANGNTGDAGAIWTVGETFKDQANNISVTVLSTSTTGFQVKISNGVTPSAPLVTSIVRASPNPTTAGSLVNFTVTFSEAVTGVDSADFSLTKTGALSASTVKAVSGGPSVYTVSANSGVGSGALRLDLPAGATITSLNGIALLGLPYLNGESYTIAASTIAPTLVSSLRASPNPTSAASVNFTLTFSEAVTGVDSADFSLTQTGGVSGAAITAVTPLNNSQSVYTVSANTGVGSGSLRLDLPTGATIASLGGTSLVGLPYTNGESYNIDKTSPNLISINAITFKPGGEISFDLVISVVNVNPGVAGAEIYLSYNPALVAPSSAPGVPVVETLPDFFGTSNVSFNEILPEILPALQCPDSTKACVHLALAGSPQTTKTSLAARFHFQSLATGTACFGFLQSTLVDANGRQVSHQAGPEGCAPVQFGIVVSGVAQRQGLPDNPNPGAGSPACSSVSASGAGNLGPVSTDSKGGFRFTNPAAGTYTFRVVYPGYLASEKTGVSLPANLSALDLGTTTLRGGDVNGDNAINILDVGVIVSKFGQVGAAIGSAANCNIPDAAVDINDDGSINISDLAITAGNWGKVAPTAWLP